MNRAISFLALFLSTTCFALPAFAECTPGTDWTSAWTDSLGQTTYTLEAPCKVYLTIPFDITATVTDSTYPNSNVGFSWAIRDNGTIVAGGGFNWITLVDGQWQRVVNQTYTGTPIDHLIQFNFVDLGAGAGAHWWGTSLIGAMTVDPYPPVANAPPTADAGPGVFILSENQSSTIVQGTASDPDGDSLTYRWLEGSREIQSSRPVGVAGAAPLDLGALPPLSIGDHTLILEVTDGTSKATDSMVVSVENSAPVAAPSAGGTVQIGEDVRLNGTVADFDGDTLSYKWLEGTTVLKTGEIATVAGGAPVTLPETVIPGLLLGTHTLTLQVTDGINSTAATMMVTVIDTIAPTLAPLSSTTILWPPNGAMTEVTIAANAHDNSGAPVLLDIRLTTNQPPQKTHDGKAIPDWSIVKIDQAAGTVVLQLRNSRSGKGGDRSYDVLMTATDQSGNASSANVTITAPHDKRRLDVTRGRSGLATGKAKGDVKVK